jgi:hypothetical protein
VLQVEELSRVLDCSLVPDSSIKIVAAILIGETSYLIAWATAVHEIDMHLYAAVDHQV